MVQNLHQIVHSVTYTLEQKDEHAFQVKIYKNMI